VEPYLLNEDITVQKSGLQLLKDTVLPTEDTLFTVFKAIDREGDVDPSESILPHASFLPIQ
jgi:hypothetical protein